MKAAYEIQVRDENEWKTIIFKNLDNFFESRTDAITEMEKYKKRFPHKITTRVAKI